MADVGGRTTKRTYVTTYTTDVDPRTLPDFASRGVVTGEDEGSYSHNGRWQDSSRRAPRGHNGGAVTAAAAAAQHPQRGPAPLPMPPQHHDQYDGADSPSYSASPASSIAGSHNGHRLRKKYTTTTVTTITTTTVLLPTMQEAYVFPSVTSHQMDQQAHGQPAVTAGPQGRVYQIDSSHASSTSASPDRHRQQQSSMANGGRLVPAQPQYAPDGTAAQAWAFQQQTANHVTTQQGQGRLPTLEELGITSYFGKEGGNGNGRQPAQQQPRRAAPYAAAGQQQQRGAGPQPWVATETRHEVEGGRRYY